MTHPIYEHPIYEYARASLRQLALKLRPPPIVRGPWSHRQPELCEFFTNELPRKFYDVRREEAR